MAAVPPAPAPAAPAAPATPAAGPPSRRVRRLFTVGSACYLLVGVSHLAVTVADALGTPDPATARAVQAMRAAPVSLPGLADDQYDLFRGFGLGLALAGVGFGLVTLAAARVAPQLLRSRSVPAVCTGLSAALLAVSVPLFPLPPVAAFAVATVAYGAVLVRAGRPDRAG